MSLSTSNIDRRYYQDIQQSHRGLLRFRAEIMQSGCHAGVDRAGSARSD